MNNLIPNPQNTIRVLSPDRMLLQDKVGAKKMCQPKDSFYNLIHTSPLLNWSVAGMATGDNGEREVVEP